jgi:ectoine hydroxylase-related dioxygenase (phytanoyl-CoA dioxygenase family)
MIDAKLVKDFQQDGYVVAPGIFLADEVARFRQHYMDLRAAGTYPGDFAAVDLHSRDPLKKYPRMINMHRWDDLSLQFLLHQRLRQWLTTLLDEEPFAVQTMLYFKPPGARGQALHQDQFFLRVQPGTCVAAWLALDRADETNGCMQVVPGTHNLPVLCHTHADTSQSFTAEAVVLPPGMEPEPVVMEAGDVFFFNGQVIHGSYPNTSKDRFRRALIGHYIVGQAERVAEFYHPVLRFDGSQAVLGINDEGGPCGLWVEQDGRPVVKLQPEDSQASRISRELLFADDNREVVLKQA